ELNSVHYVKCQTTRRLTSNRRRFLWIDGLSVDDPFSQINSLGRPVFPGWPATVLPTSSEVVLPQLNGEFDPGSGCTLAACLTHASRTVNEGACSLRISGERVSNT